eukprot:TRINITY_DN3443_c0_g1_i4.p1 TRINITY_DN3443_c0_g1~~TRINITY_DN3443_c0_g1_i4.p1  ORF type:complete len:216 (+),score=58.66 TRINITY_DN3443_c0_g1_i4:101-748(+)
MLRSLVGSEMCIRDRAQSKKRTEVLHEQLLREQRSAHEALMRAESAEAAMASMHKELLHARTNNLPPPASGATSTTGSVSGKQPRSDIRRPTSPHHQTSLKRPSTTTTSTPHQSTISRARVIPPPAASSSTTAAHTAALSKKVVPSSSAQPGGVTTTSSRHSEVSGDSRRHSMGLGGGGSDSNVDGSYRGGTTPSNLLYAATGGSSRENLSLIHI